jgi:hypothetical protein
MIWWLWWLILALVFIALLRIWDDWQRFWFKLLIWNEYGVLGWLLLAVIIYIVNYLKNWILEIFERWRERRQQELALVNYLQEMQELIHDKELGRSGKDNEIREVARSRTLIVLRNLNGDSPNNLLLEFGKRKGQLDEIGKRKGQLVRFLYEAGLIGKSVEESGERRVIEAIIDLQTADLSHADLRNAYLKDADLSGANLSHANLSGAYLRDAYLIGTNLRDAELRDADLSDANLSGADLRDAKLRDANLSDANLSDVNLRSAWECTDKQLVQAMSLVGATLPPGQGPMTYRDWEEFKKLHRQ